MNYAQFNSIGEAFEFMRKQEDAANAHLAPAQQDITWGHYFVKFAPYDDILIYGYVMTEDEVESGEREAGAYAEELTYTMERIRDSHARGYLFGWHYSIVEPTGELGSSHRADCWPIERDLFEAAKAANWHLAAMDAKMIERVGTVYGAYRRHLMGLV